MFRHRPAASSRSVLDDAYLGQVPDDRWSGLGIRAYCFASDRRVVLADHARHIQRDLPAGRTDRIERTVFRVPVRLATVLDLTDPAVVAAIGSKPIASWILDVSTTQAVSRYLQQVVHGSRDSSCRPWRSSTIQIASMSWSSATRSTRQCALGGRSTSRASC